MKARDDTLGIDRVSLLKAIERMYEFNLVQRKIESKDKKEYTIVRLKDKNEKDHFFIEIEKSTKERPIYKARKIDVDNAAFSEKLYMIKKSKSLPITADLYDPRKVEADGLMKLYSGSVYGVVFTTHEDGEELETVFLGSEWRGEPLQTLSPDDHLILSPVVSQFGLTDRLSIIRQILAQLNILHTKGPKGDMRVWGDPKGENILINTIDKKPVVSLIDMAGSMIVEDDKLAVGRHIETSPWYFVPEKYPHKGKARQGIKSDFPPLVAVFAQLLGQPDVLLEKRKAVFGEPGAKGYTEVVMAKKPPERKEIKTGQLVMVKDKGLTVYWLKRDEEHVLRLVSKTIPEKLVMDNLQHLPELGKTSRDTELIKAIVSIYGCSGSEREIHKEDELKSPYLVDDILKEYKELPTECVEAVKRFLEKMQSADYAARPSKDMPLEFFSKLHQYTIETEPFKKKWLLDTLVSLSGRQPMPKKGLFATRFGEEEERQAVVVHTRAPRKE